MVTTMAYAHRIDWGRLPCVPLRVGREASDVLRHPGWCSRGDSHAQSRLDILRLAKQKSVSLRRLSDELDVKWKHFEEWARLCDAVCWDIFFSHLPWKDELLHEDNGVLRRKIGVREGDDTDGDESGSEESL